MSTVWNTRKGRKEETWSPIFLVDRRVPWCPAFFEGDKGMVCATTLHPSFSCSVSDRTVHSSLSSNYSSPPYGLSESYGGVSLQLKVLLSWTDNNNLVCWEEEDLETKERIENRYPWDLSSLRSSLVSRHFLLVCPAFLYISALNMWNMGDKRHSTKKCVM